MATNRSTGDAGREAARGAGEAAGRSAEVARAGIEATGTYLDVSTEAGRRALSAWVNGTEATLLGTFDVQNAALDASLSVLEAADNSSREALQQWAEAARQAQQAALEAWRTSMRATEQMAENARPSERPAR